MQKSKRPLHRSVSARWCNSPRTAESRLLTSPVNRAFPARGSSNDTRIWLAQIVFLSQRRHTLLYSVCLYSQADEHQR